MDIYAEIYDNRHNIRYDVSEAIYDIAITSYLDDNAGKCTFNVIRIDGLAFWEGATITITIDGKGIFRGFIFTKSRDEDVEFIKCTAYDQIRYLKNKSFRVFSEKTSSEIFSQICGEYGLKYKVVDASDYKCATKVNNNEYLYKMIKNALDDTLVNTGEWYIIRDNFGTLEHINIKNLDSGVILGDKSGVTKMKYKTSIDKDVYNTVTVYSDNTKSKEHKSVTVSDGSKQNLKEWGILQLYEKIDGDANEAQMKQRAEGLLKLHNNKSRDLSFSDCIGDFKVFAGCFVTIQMADIGDLSVFKKLLVTECTHKIKNNEHLMDVKVRLVV